jgi:hypothetical protein
MWLMQSVGLLPIAQGGSCGFGMRGQKSRSGTGAGSRPGFQGGQTPLYRQMPKLRGIAGGAPPSLTFRLQQPPCALFTRP